MSQALLSGDKLLSLALGQIAGTIQSPDLIAHLGLFDSIAQEASSYKPSQILTLILLVEQMVEKRYETKYIKKIIESKKEVFLEQGQIWLWACAFSDLETIKYIESSGIKLDYQTGALNSIINHRHKTFEYLFSTKKLVLTEGLLAQAIMRHLNQHGAFSTINLIVQNASDIKDLSEYSRESLKKIKIDSYNQEKIAQLEALDIMLEKALILKGVNKASNENLASKPGLKI